MIPFSHAMKEAVSKDVTTLCYCWKLTRKDGLVLGFTDHDQQLEFENTLFRPNTGFIAKEAETVLGLSIGNSEIEGALDAAEISQIDLSSGLYDAASVALYLVNWETPVEFSLLRTSYISRVEQTDGVWRAELEGFAADYSIKRGRLYRRNCDAEVGDARCGLQLGSNTFSGQGAIVSLQSALEFAAADVSHFESGWFNDGIIHWTSGANANKTTRVSAHIKNGADVVLTLRDQPMAPLAVGDGFNVVSGCDKRFETCKGKFSNSLNFRGFPHMPGNDQAYSYARDGMSFDGGPVVE